MNWMLPKADGVEIHVHVVPRAAVSAVAGLHGDRLKIRLQAPPVEGRANRELVRFLARRLGIPASRITILSGTASRTKRVFLAGLSPAQVSQLAPGPPPTQSSK